MNVQTSKSGELRGISWLLLGARATLFSQETTRCGGRKSLDRYPWGAGWRGRIRTFDLLIQSQAPYRLATRQCVDADLAAACGDRVYPGFAAASTKAPETVATR